MQDKSGGFDGTGKGKPKKNWDKIPGTGDQPVSQRPKESDKAQVPSEARKGKWTPNQ